MEFKNTIFAILTIFCVLLSACAVSAAEDIPDYGVDYTLDDIYEDYGWDDVYGDYGLDEGYDDYDDLDAEGVHNSMFLPPDYTQNEAAVMNATSPTGHAAGENVAAGNTTGNETGNATGNTTGNATGNATNVTSTPPHAIPTTGNPILLLMAVVFVIAGGYILRRK